MDRIGLEELTKEVFTIDVISDEQIPEILSEWYSEPKVRDLFKIGSLSKLGIKISDCLPILDKMTCPIRHLSREDSHLDGTTYLWVVREGCWIFSQDGEVWSYLTEPRTKKAQEEKAKRERQQLLMAEQESNEDSMYFIIYDPDDHHNDVIGLIEAESEETAMFLSKNVFNMSEQVRCVPLTDSQVKTLRIR